MKQTAIDLLTSFDNPASNYDQVTSNLSHYIIETTDRRNLEHSLKGVMFDRTLDAGGGTGKWIPFLNKYSIQIVLFDISNKSLDIARDKYGDRYGNIEFICGNLESTDFDSGYFDFIFAQGGALSYTPNPWDFLSEQYRLLKPNGLLWLEFYNSFGWAVECDDLIRKKQFASVTADLVFTIPDRDYPARMFNIEYLKEKVTKLHFSLLEEYGTGILLNTIPGDKKKNNRTE